MEENLHSTILASVVFVNISAWLMEQFADINLEFLSISYVITGLFIIFLKLLQVEMLKSQKDKVKFQKLAHQHDQENRAVPVEKEKKEIFLQGLSLLTATERRVYYLYLDVSTTKEILAALDIIENTLKYHNKNIYGKLGVSSRKELIVIARALNV